MAKTGVASGASSEASGSRSATPEDLKPIVVGVVLVDLPEKARDAAIYLITQMNLVQRVLEFEVYDSQLVDDIQLVSSLGRGAVLVREHVRESLASTRQTVEEALRRDMDRCDLTDRALPHRYVLVSEAQLTDGYFSVRSHGDEE